ncbi:MAG: hypothetical protein AAF845_04930 [Bacteroidota bacterium]
MRRLALAVLALASSAAFAQGQNNYGSIYSLYGVGERLDLETSQAAMLGRSGAALRSGSYTAFSNPALWSDLGVTTFSAGASLTTVRGEDALSDDASVGTSGELAGLHLGIPIYPARLGMTFAVGPYSRVNYRSAVRDSLLVGGDMTPYTLNLEGAGGLQQFRAGLGVRIGSVLQVGASGDVIFGTEETLQRTDFDDAGFVETRQSEATRLRGVTATLGAAATARSLATDDDALTVGLAFTLPTSLSAARTVTLGESLDRDTLAASVDGDATLPLVLRGGLAYRSGSRWVATADALYEPWTRFDSTLPVGGFDPEAADNDLQDRLRLGGGVEVTPAGRDRRASALRRASYRIGAYAERGLYAPAGQSVSTLALTGGVSVPNRFTGARFDLGFEVGTRGSAEDVLVRDTFVRGTFTLNFGERWFVRRRFN